MEEWMDGERNERKGRWEKLIEGKMVDCFCVHAFEELRPLLPRGFACLRAHVCACVCV